MLTVCPFLIFSIAYSTGNPVRVAFDKGHLKEDALSNLQLLIPIKRNQQLMGKHHRLDTSGDLDIFPKGPFSAIPSEEFVLNDARQHIFLVKPQKTTKKDLSQDQSRQHIFLVKPQKTIKKDLSQDQISDTLSSAELDNEAETLEILLQKCQKLLQIERLRSHRIPILKQSLVHPESEDRQSLLSLCRQHLGLVVESEEAMSYDGVQTNQGLGPLLQGALSPQGHKSPQLVGLAGQGGVAGNFALDSIGGSYGEIGLGDEAGNVVVRETGEIDNVVGQSGSARNLITEGNIGNNLGADGQGVVPHLFLANHAKNTNNMDRNIKQARNKVARIYKKIDPKFYVWSLAYGGEGAQIDNFALSGGTLGNSKASSCGHSHCIHINLFSLKALKADEDNLSVMNTLRPAPLMNRVKVAELNKFRPIGGRRDWMTLDDKYDDRKPWARLKDSRT